MPHLCSYLCCPQVDKLEEAESQRKTEEEVTEPQPMVFGRSSSQVKPGIVLQLSIMLCYLALKKYISILKYSLSIVSSIHHQGALSLVFCYLQSTWLGSKQRNSDCMCVSGQQLMLTTSPAPVTPQTGYPGYAYPPAGYPAAPAAGYPPPPPAYGFNM